MTEQEKAAKAEAEAKAKDAEAKKQADEAEFENSIADLSDEEKEAKRAEKQKATHSDNQIDYKAELEKERKAKEKAEKALAESRFKKSEEKRKSGEEDDEEDKSGDDSLTEERVAAMLDDRDRKTQKMLEATEARNIAAQLATSPDELELIIEKWQTTTFAPHLSLTEQIESACAMANSKRLIGERNEALRAAQAARNANKDGSGTHHVGLKGTEPKVASDLKGVLERQGFTFNTSNNLYEKKLPNGDVLVKDPKTKKTYVRKAK